MERQTRTELEQALRSSGGPRTIQCMAHSSRSGEQCKRRAILGGTVCPFHGGSAPQVRQAAADRIRELLPDALDVLAEVMRDKSAQPAARVRAADSLLDRGGFKAIDVTVTLDEDQANGALDAAIAQALADRGHVVPEELEHTTPHTEEPAAQ